MMLNGELLKVWHSYMLISRRSTTGLQCHRSARSHTSDMGESNKVGRDLIGEVVGCSRSRFLFLTQLYSQEAQTSDV